MCDKYGYGACRIHAGALARAPHIFLVLVALGVCHTADLSKCSCEGTEMAEPQAPIPTKVLAAEIGSSVQIVGSLGRPLGEWIVIRGAWSFPKEMRKRMEPDFVVTSVNGTRLEKPVSFGATFFIALRPNEVPQEEGHVWEVLGFETGGFKGIPHGDPARKTSKVADPVGLGKGWQDVPVETGAAPFRFGFYTEYRYRSFKIVN